MYDFQHLFGSTTPFSSRRAAGLLAIAAALLVAMPARAQVTWDATVGTTGPQDGAGTWSTSVSGTNWWDGLTNVAWPNLTTSSAIFGAGSGAAGTVTVSGSVITNAMTFNAPGSGTYTLSGGTISLEGTSPTITANVNASIGSVLAGSAGLVKAGNGTLTLSSANSYTGGTQIDAGGITTSNASGFSTGAIAIGGAGTATLAVSGAASITWANAATGSGVLVLRSGASVSQNTIATYSGDLSGFTGTVRIESGGDFVGIGGNYLTGSNARWEVNNSTGSYYLFTNSGTTVAMGELSGNGRIGTNNGAASTWEVGALATSSTFSGVFVNAQSNVVSNLRKVGSGTLTLTGISTSTGSVNVIAGTLQIGAGGTTGWTSMASVTGSTGATLAFNRSDNYGGAFGKPITGGLALAHLGSGTLTLSSSNSYTGGTQIDAGVINVTNGFALGTGAVAVGSSGTALFHGTGLGGYTIANTITGSGNISVRSHPGGTISSGANYTTLTGTLAGFSGTITVDPFQSAVLFGNNALDGSNAKWVVTNTQNATTGYLLSQTAGAVVKMGELSGGGRLGATNGSGGTIWEVGALGTSSTFSGAFVNALNGSTFGSSLRKVGSGTLTLTGSSSSVGSVNVFAGTLQIGAGGTVGSVTSMASVTGSTGATLAFNRSDNYGGAFGKPISGGLALAHLGSGTLTLSSSNSYTGGTQIDAGLVSGSVNNAFGSGTVSIAASGAARYTQSAASATGMSNAVVGSGTLEIVATTVQAFFSGDLSGFTGTVLMNGTANYLGLSGNAASLLSGSNAKWVVTTATNFYFFPANDTTSSTIALGEVSGSGNLGSASSQNATWEIGALSTSSTFSGRIMNTNIGGGAGVAILRKVGSGTLTLTGSNTYTGGTQLNGGVLGLGSANALSSSGAISFGGGTLQFSASNTTDYSSRFSTAAGQAYSLDTNGQNITIGTALSSSGGTLTKHGLGALTLSAANTYTGDTILSAGTLKLGSGGSFANSPLIVVGDAGSSGAVLDLTAKSTFAIGAGQTLKGKGTVLLGPSTALTINGLLSPGNSPGLLTYDGGGTVTLSGTMLMEVWGTSRGANPGYDAIDLINGTDLTFGGILQLDFNQLFADGTTFNLFTPDGTSSLANTFSSITMVGSSYTDLTFTNNAGFWTTNTGAANQSMTFDSSTGILSIAIAVPEPSGIALAGLGLAAAALASRRRRRCPEARSAS